MTQKLLLAALLCLFSLEALAQDRLLIGYGGFSGVHLPIWVTKELGLLEKHRLMGELVMIPGGSRQMQALISDSMQFSHIDSTAPITAIHRGADLVIVAGALNKFPFSIVAQKEIRQPADLRGKRIGESTYDYYAPQFSIPPRVSREGLRTTADFLVQKGAAGVVERSLDQSLLDELEKEGSFKTAR